MTLVTKIWWVRHLPIDLPEHLEGCYIGQTDVEAVIPPTRTELELLPEQALWFSSPLKRAKATAEWLGARNLQLAPELKEQYFGTWEGKAYDQVWGEAQHLDWEKPELIKPPQGESFMELCERVGAWLDTALKHYDGQNLIIVSHAGVIRAGLKHALGMRPSEVLSTDLNYASVTQVSYSDTFAIADYINR